jgi:carbon monoxide dehydrogenase subunit G
MELTNDFRVAVPVERAWSVLTDIELIAPCLPGAQLQEVEGDEYRGVVKVKVGPITAQYKGAATFASQDPDAHVAVLRAEGRETRGQGNASATITATLAPDGEGTAVSLATDLMITGKVAQFGRGVLADVSAKLLDQFVENLESTVLVEDGPAGDRDADHRDADGGGTGEADGAGEPAPPAGVRTIEGPEAQPVDLLETAGAPVARRVAPILAVIALAWLLKKLLSRRRD